MKRLQDYRVVDNERLPGGYSLLRLTPANDGELIPECRPGQFVQVATRAQGVLLRRPISINRVDHGSKTLWLLVRIAGEGTLWMAGLQKGDTVNLLIPLGNGFTLPSPVGRQGRQRMLLVGGGVGVAPLLQLGIALKGLGCEPEFLLGAKTKQALLLTHEFEKLGKVHLSTDDGTAGVPGVVTQNPALSLSDWDRIYCCGPAPMMKAVAAVAHQRGIDCEVSLENMMACGLGACLCCVEKTVKGNVCVCTDGPVFNISQLTW